MLAHKSGNFVVTRPHLGTKAAWKNVIARCSKLEQRMCVFRKV
jgi:hypothetical protein